MKLNLSGHYNSILEAQGFHTLSFQVDLAEGLEKVADKVRARLASEVPADTQITVVLPGLAPLAGIVLVTIHSISGHFPRVVALVRNPQGDFVPTAPWDAQEWRNSRRVKRTGVEVL